MLPTVTADMGDTGYPPVIHTRRRNRGRIGRSIQTTAQTRTCTKPAGSGGCPPPPAPRLPSDLGHRETATSPHPEATR